MRACLFVLGLAVAPGAAALTPAAKEFLEISKKLEPVQCEKRQLRRAMALAQVQNRDAELKQLQARFSALDRQPQTAKLERRLAQLEPQVKSSSDPEDLNAISLQRREAFYRCE